MSLDNNVDDAGARRAEFFKRVYRDNVWDGRESRSGQGSGIEQTRGLIENLPGCLRRHHVTSFLDVPCGDFHWMKEVDFGSTLYTGGDVVTDVIEQNSARYGSALRQFKIIDIINDDLPHADMIFVRDCFIHFTLDLTMRSLENIARSSIKYACLLHDADHDRYPDRQNFELDRAQWGVNFEYRPIDFELPPFSFPSPIDAIPESEYRRDFGGGGKYFMAVWEVAQIRSALGLG